MKSNKFCSIMMMLVLVLGTTIVFSSCSKDDEDGGEYSIIGTWKMTYEDYDEYEEHFEYIFYSNGTVVETCYIRGQQSDEEYEYEYLYENDRLTIIEDKYTYTVVVHWVNKNKFTISDDGDILIFTRQ